MSLTCTVGGARGTLGRDVGAEVASLLDRAYGAEGSWDDDQRRGFGALELDAWQALRRNAVAQLGADALPNLLALDDAGRGVYVPANVQAVALALPDGATLQCASLPGLRRELFELAEPWRLPLEDHALQALLDTPAEPAIRAFARLVLAANDAMRRDCPLWLLGEALTA